MAQTTVTASDFGKTADGAAVTAYELKGAQLTVKIITWGAHVTSVLARDKAGNVADVVLGYGAQAGYNADDATYMGSVVGRYGNRIGKGRFTLDGHPYQLTLNNNGNTLHGGTPGFDRKLWTGKKVPNGVEMTLVSPDGDQGFPGTLTAHVRYTLVGDKLRMDYSATTDKTTVVNLTQHSYFNLAGGGDILGHVLKIDAAKYTAIDAGLIPTGALPPVAGTPFDFTTPTAIGARINTPDEQLKLAGGYDHNWVLTNATKTMHEAAVVVDPGSGRKLIVSTTEPGVQFYSGNFLDGTKIGRDGKPYAKYAGLCLETQHFPDSPNQPSFPSTTLKPGQTYRTSTVFEFTVAK
jgi:aldose 1-epimerase